MIQIATDENFIYIKGISDSAAEKLNAAWLKSIKAWRLPKNTFSLRELWKLYPLDTVVKIGKKVAENERMKLMSKSKHRENNIDERLRPYQVTDIKFLENQGNYGIFNQQRTGKTPTALFAARNYDLNIIICPASLLLQWEGEVRNWMKDVETIVYNGTKKQREKKLNVLKSRLENGKRQYLILSYETLRNDVNMILTIAELKNACMIVDEAHRLKNHRTKTYKAVKALGSLVQKRLALTGTPAMNHPSDVFGILHFLYPEKFPSYWQFVERYFYINDGYFGKEVGDWKRKDELQHVLSLISVQRKRKDVMTWLPEKQYMTVKLEANAKQMKAYKDMADTFVYEDENVEVDAPSILAQLTRLRQITLAPEILGIEANSAKEEWLLDFIEDNQDEKIIIFSSFTSYLKMLKEKIGERAVMIHGEMSADEKQRAASAFQKGEKGVNILLSNIVAGGTGWTLDKATTTIFLDRHYNPTLNEQAEDRMVDTREGATQAKTVIDVIVKDTIDEHIHYLLEKKVDIIKYVNDYGISKLMKGGINND